MRIGLVAAAILATLVVLVPVGGAAPDARITPSSIGSVGLGLSALEYTRALGEKPFRTRFANGTTRLTFSLAQISVILGARGRGVRITTAAAAYTLPGGIGACSRLAVLARKVRLTPYAVTGAFGAEAVVYRWGRLWFTLADQAHLGSVTLASGKPALAALVAEAQCGSGGERGGSKG